MGEWNSSDWSFDNLKVSKNAASWRVIQCELTRAVLVDSRLVVTGMLEVLEESDSDLVRENGTRPYGEKTMNDTAYLSQNQQEGLACFEYDGRRIYFATAGKLEKFTKVLEWNNGYLVVRAKYEGHPDEEDYIDLRPILDHLKIDRREFLESIRNVEICDEAQTQSVEISGDETDVDFVFSVLQDDAVEEDWI